MGGCLIEDDALGATRAKLNEIRNSFRKNKNIHASEISHVQKVHLIRELKSLSLPFFGVISDKRTLRGFREKSGGNPQDYYNRTALYLLSKLGVHLARKGIPGRNVRIIFEERSHDYKRFTNYLCKVSRNPTGDGVQGIASIHPYNLSTAKKDDEHLLAVPDIIAHALFAAFDRNRNNFKITEVRYMQEMMEAFCEADKPVRLQLIQPERVQSICSPTSKLLDAYGIGVPKK